MGIKFLCPDCGRKLHVKSFQAGKKGICPHCTGRFRIPADGIQNDAGLGTATPLANSEPKQGAVAAAPLPTPPGTPAPGPMSPAPAVPTAEQSAIGGGPAAVPVPSGVMQAVPTGQQVPVAVPTQPAPSEAVVGDSEMLSESPNAVWYVRPASGGQYGPAAGDVMAKWLTEGRVAHDSLVWREGWSEWKPAAEIFEQLRRQTPPDAIAATSAFAADTSAAHPAMMPSGGASTSEPTTAPRARRKDNTGVLVTVILLGIVSVGLVITLFIVLNR